MSKMKAFVPRPLTPEPIKLPRRDRILNALTIAVGCLIVALILRGLFELVQHFLR